MRNIGPTIVISIRNNLRSKTLFIGFISITLMCVVGAALVGSLLFIAPETEAEFPDRGILEICLGLIMYTTCFIGMGINLNVFAFVPVTREKSRGNIESLLATPLKVKDIWLAKSLAVFLPGLILGELFTLVAMMVIQYLYSVPGMGFLIPTWIAISSFIALPAVYLCLSLLVFLIGMTGRPITGHVIAIVFLNVVAALVINLGAHRVLDPLSWPFTLVNFGIAAVIGIVVILLQPRLTKERIVLSCKE